MPMAVKLSLLSGRVRGPVMVFDTVTLTLFFFIKIRVSSSTRIGILFVSLSFDNFRL